MKTKEKIAQIALKLFSTYGFEAVSVRDIASAVGIKESTIYYHYENKYDILKSLQNAFLDITRPLMQLLEDNTVFTVSKDIFFEISHGFITQYLLSDFVIQFVKLLMIEQAANHELRDIFENYFYHIPIAFQTPIFEKMSASGLLRDYDPQFIASHYYANIFFLYQKHIILKKPSQSDIAAFKSESDRFFKQFMSLYDQEAPK
jgi:AcrR family transcriptional regulator